MTFADRSRLPAVGPDPSFAFPAIVRHTLPNGLAVRTVQHAGVPVLTMVLVVDAGSSSDPRAHEGLAALSADMVDEGTGALSALDVADTFARLGAEYDVEVGSDVTFLTLTTLTRFAEPAAALLADLVVRPNLLESDFERVRQLRLDRLKQLKDMPTAMAERAFLKLLYPSHPYGHLSIGTDASLRSLTPESVVAFHRAHYRPGRATLVVGGPWSHERMFDLAAQTFGAWGGEAVDRAAVAVSETPAPAARLFVVPRDGAAQSELRIGHLSARRDSPDYPALLVMNAVMGGQFVSRINLKLREEKGYTYGARTGFDWRRELSPFVLQASVHSASTAEAVRDALGELEAIRSSRPPTDAELSLAKASLTRGYPRNFETVGQVSRSVAQLAVFGLSDDYFAEFVPKVNGVTAADVASAAERYIDPARLTTLLVGDFALTRQSLLQLGLGEPVLLPAEV